jgi:integration host factor subunit alpha
MTLSKDHLVSAVTEANGYPRNRSVELIETLLELLKSKLVSGEDVLISGFGKFCVKEKRQRRGRNPATGEAMMLDARRVVTFKCSGQLRDKINKSQ